MSSSAGTQPQLPAYQYKELPQGKKAFRLLKLESCRGQRDYAQLISYELSRAPEYTAISYTWGSKELSHSLYLSDSSELLVPATVAQLLEDLSPGVGNGSLHLWIDFICINQSDNYEKDHQIPLMRQIYTNAAEVVCYLGRAEDAKVAFDFLPVVYNFFLQSSAAARAGVDPTLLNAFKEANNPFTTNPTASAAFQRLLANRYWTRAWIIQEIISSKKVRLRYGDSFVDWDVLGTVIEVFWAYANGNELLLESIGPDVAGDVILSMNCVDNLRTIKRLLDKGTPIPIQDVVLYSCHSNATEGRDKVLAILGLSDDADHPELQPDHTLSIQEVYTRVTWHCLQRGSFALLNLAGTLNHARRRSTLGLPSWVPDLTKPPLHWPLDNPQALYHAGGPPEGAQVRLSNGSRLSVKGFSVGKVIAVSGVMAPEAELTDTRDYRSIVGLMSNSHETSVEMSYRHFDSMVKTTHAHVPDPYPSVTPSSPQIPQHEALWRTMVGDEGFGPGGILFPAGSEVANAFATYAWMLALAGMGQEEDGVRLAFLQGLLGQRLMPTAQDVAACNMFAQLAGRKILFRKLVVVEGGYLGFADANVQVGDEFCVFLGAKTPYVVRRDGEGDGSKLLGEAYLHGFMKGEVIGSGMEETWFELT